MDLSAPGRAVTYWLALTLCLMAADGGEVCEMRLAPVTVEGPLECQRLAAMIMREDPAYRMPMLCTSARPDLPSMSAPVAPWRWS